MTSIDAEIFSYGYASSASCQSHALLALVHGITVANLTHNILNNSNSIKITLNFDFQVAQMNAHTDIGALRSEIGRGQARPYGLGVGAAGGRTHTRGEAPAPVSQSLQDLNNLNARVNANGGIPLTSSVQAPNFYSGRHSGSGGPGIKHEFPRASMPERGSAGLGYGGGGGGLTASGVNATGKSYYTPMR